jgi:hypothetical protein
MWELQVCLVERYILMDYEYFLGVFFTIFDTLFTLMFIHCEYKCISDSIESKQ